MLNDILSILPLILLVVWACVLLLVDLFIPRDRKGLTALFAALGLLASLAISLTQIGRVESAFNGMVTIDGFSVFLSITLLATGLMGVALAYDYLKRMGIERGEYYALLLFSIGGMMLMALAADLIVVFLALEWLSIPLYVLAGFARPRQESEEAAMKYFLLGAFASGFVVYGVALVFGATGSTALAAVVDSLNAGVANLPLLSVGAGLILVGFAFKVAAVPFHMWTPDVYQGAPTSVTAFMAVGAKIGGFAALLRVFVLTFPGLVAEFTPVLWMLAALTLVLGNVVAIAQRNMKRLLAYSSIAHAGYIMMAVVPYGQPALSGDAVASALFYLVAYAFTSFGAWAVVIALEQAEGKGLALEDYAGLGRKYPLLAVAMAVFMLSFTGVPPTLGFAGKLFVFRTVLEGGFIGLALIGVLTSLVSAYYYLRVIVVMFMQEGDPVVRSEPWLNAATLAAAVGTVALSIFAAPLFDWAAQAVLRLL
jgi:NADH-quinone oxidoreductase subunit N